MINAFAIVLKSDFDKTKDFIEDCSKKIKTYFLLKSVLEGYKEFYIGQKLKIDFDDGGFGSYELEGVVLDILVEKEENFGFLFVPEDNEKFLPTMNFMLKKYGIDNLSVPKDGCFFARHIKNDRFSMETEEKSLANNVNVTIPKLFKIPFETLKKLLIFRKVKTEPLQKCIERILETEKE